MAKNNHPTGVVPDITHFRVDLHQPVNDLRRLRDIIFHAELNCGMGKLLPQLTVRDPRRLRGQLTEIQPANEEEVLLGQLQTTRKAVAEVAQLEDDILLLHADRRYTDCRVGSTSQSRMSND